MGASSVCLSVCLSVFYIIYYISVYNNIHIYILYIYIYIIYIYCSAQGRASSCSHHVHVVGRRHSYAHTFELLNPRACRKRVRPCAVRMGSSAVPCKLWGGASDSLTCWRLGQRVSACTCTEIRVPVGVSSVQVRPGFDWPVPRAGSRFGLDVSAQVQVVPGPRSCQVAEHVDPPPGTAIYIYIYIYIYLFMDIIFYILYIILCIYV